MRIAVLADPHVCTPWMKPDLMRRIVAQVQGVEADLILLAGDFLADRSMPGRHIPAEEVVPLFADMTAPLGVFAVMGNHDYADCAAAMASDGRNSSVRDAFADTSVTMMGNDARALRHGKTPFWLVTLDSQRGRGKKNPGYEDPATAYAKVDDDAPVILLAHEPDYFARADRRAMLQISGHTHAGQFVLFGRRPMVPSAYGDRYAMGHIVEQGRHLVVSAGLGYSGLPFRFGAPPEITLIEIASPASGRNTK